MPNDPLPQRSHPAYLAWGVCLGIFGAHNFYAGRKAAGVVKVLLLLLAAALIPGWGKAALASLAVVVFIMCCWVAVELMAVRTDALGRSLLRPRRWVAAVAALAVLAAGVSALAVPLLELRFEARRIMCMSNLKNLGMAMVLYAQDHQGILPGDIGFMERPDLERCAADRAHPYVYFGAGANLKELPALTPLVMDRLPPPHRGQVHICFSDGHVERVDAPESYLEAVRTLAVDPVPEIVLKNAARADREAGR